ncbi:transient receptor potential cation channel subfamily V member 6-like [Stegostoma tigrinum]|uniref:transient receptor potential cation channel subfamily V member 6-like n=1 Tax=Stegostoma tigrinum TaxID=3053191 RepID=UPI00202B21CD|nr:transient receptor potential cation channel subfamily V member 6-like [Stegostoma tigrinum]
MYITVNVNDTARHGSEFFKAAHINDTVSMKSLLTSKDFDPAIRGNLEETILHTALLNGNKEIAEFILDMMPSLINEPMTSDMYRGETPMHIAVLKQDVEMVKELLKRGADVMNARATGSCFVPGEECQCYYGEYLLSFAACIGNEEIVRTLIKHCAPLEAQDSLGNTVLHVLVLQPEKEQAYSMYDLITSLVSEKHHQFVENIVNNDGYTPLKLAAAEGDFVMFNYLVQKQKKIYWTMGTISYCVYDLTNIDTWGDQKSVLDIITTSRNSEVRKLVDAKPVKELLHQKWNSFGYKYFLIWMFSYIMYIIIFTVSSLYRPLKPIPPGLSDNLTIRTQKTLAESYQTKEDYLRLVGELITIIGALVILISEIPYLYRIGPRNYLGNTSIGGPFPLLLVCYSLLIAVAVIMRILGNVEEAVPISLALIIGWCNTIYFARGFKMLGQFSIMIQKIIFGDFMQWCCLVLICITGFTSAFYVMFQTLDLRNYPYFRDFPMTMYTTVELMMGLIDLPVPYDKPTPSILYVGYVLYMIFVYLLLLNLLIAMMDDTYWRIAYEREELWKVQIAATILLLERRVPVFLRIRSGVPGRSLGFDDDKWYIGVEEILTETVGTKVQVPALHAQKYSHHLGWDAIRKNLAKIISMRDSSESTSF